MKKVFCIIVILMISSLMSCFEFKEPYPGFADVFYESPYLDKGQSYLEQDFKAHINTNITLRLVLENIGKNKIFLEKYHLNESRIEDSGQIIQLHTVLKEMDIKISNKTDNINISYDEVISYNKNFHLVDYKTIIEIPFPHFKITERKNKISIYLPNLYLRSWKVKLVLGKGATGGL